MSNRAERRAIAKAEKKSGKKMLTVPQPNENSKGWVSYMKDWGIDMDKWFISFSGWLRLTKNEKSAAVLQMIEEDMIHPDRDSEKSTESGWVKVNKEEDNAGREDSEVSESTDSAVLQSECGDEE